MKLIGVRGQAGGDQVFATTITIGSGGGSYLVLPNQTSRSFLEISTGSATAVGYIAMGCGEATAALTSGAVSTITVVDGGFNYTLAPVVTLLGGGNGGNPTYVGSTGDPLAMPPGSPNPGTRPQALTPSGYPATAVATLSGGAVSAVTVTAPGSGYVVAPYVWLTNNTNDPNGCASPFRGSAGAGRVITSGNPLYYNGTDCPTSPVGIYCATSGATFFVKWMP